MQPLSATDAVGPAFAHARSILAPRPFRPGHFFKIALLAAFTQSTFFSVCFTYPLQSAQLATHSHPAHHANFAASGAGVAGALGVGLLLIFGLVLLLSLLYLYAACRARATLFHLVVLRGGRVRQAWRRQRAATSRYFGLYLLAMVLFWTVLAATLGPFVIGMVKTTLAHGHGPDAVRAISSQVVVLAGIFWLLLLPIWIALDAILQDFILPSLSLDLRPDLRAELRNAAATSPIRDAFVRFATLLRRAPGQLILFLILRTVVGFAIALALGLIAAVALGILGLAFYGGGKALYSALWSGGVGAHTIFFTAIAALTLTLAVLYLLTVTAIYGVSGTFKTSYAAIFYSNYYPELAALLRDPPPNEDLVGATIPGSLPSNPPLRARADLPPEVW